ncbi:MAG: ACT domain-containing protein [Desulfovibrio sp.]|nr:ACT domain-containing protein [Desulfovibrio sp.]
MEQLSVFLENKVGRLAEVTEVLRDAGVNIRALSLADTSEFGILRLITDTPRESCSALRARGFTAALTQVTAVKMPDCPGGLCAILKLLEAGGVNVEYMYGFHAAPASEAVLVFRFDKGAPALDILRRNSIPFLSGAAG